MTEPGKEKVDRRDFLELLVGWVSACLALGASSMAAFRFMVPNVLYEPSRRYKAKYPDDYSEGATFIEKKRVFIIRRGNRFQAVSAVCTHLGCTVSRASIGNGFQCPCHGSLFDADGSVLDGPAPKPLRWFSISLSRDGRLVINTAKPVPPDRYLAV